MRRPILPAGIIFRCALPNEAPDDKPDLFFAQLGGRMAEALFENGVELAVFAEAAALGDVTDGQAGLE